MQKETGDHIWGIKSAFMKMTDILRDLEEWVGFESQT